MKTSNLIWVALLVGLAALVGWRMLRPAAPIPGAFSSGIRLEEAVQRGSAEQRPVLAVVTADWCPPCQALKRGALSDARVTAFITEHTIPVYVDADAHGVEAGSLGVSSIPASVVIRDGVIVARTGGAVGAEEYLAWLKGAIGPLSPGG